MTLSISFYNNIKYTKDDFIGRDKDFFGNGVVNLTDFPLTYNSNMTVNVGQGTAWVDGYRIHNDSSTVMLTVPAADATNPRIDIVQIGHDDINSTYSLTVKPGVAAASPVEPGADSNYIKLYAINVAAGATSITSANVLDKRALVPLNVSSSQISSGGSVTNTDPAYLAVKNGSYVTAGDGISTTAGTNMETVTLNPATATTLGGVIAGSGINIDQFGKISVTPYTLPNDVAKYDTAQTWTATQTFSTQFASTVANGTAPFTVTSATVVANLNADKLDGHDATDFAMKTFTAVALNNASGTQTAYMETSTPSDVLTLQAGTGISLTNPQNTGTVVISSTSSGGIPINSPLYWML